MPRAARLASARSRPPILSPQVVTADAASPTVVRVVPQQRTRRKCSKPSRSPCPKTASPEAGPAAGPTAGPTRRARAGWHPARARQPSRADHRRDRHRQDRHAAAARRTLLQDRRAGRRGRRQGRFVGHREGGVGRHRSSTRASRRSASSARRSTRATVTFWDVFGEKGHPLRATVSDMGPLLLARMLNLNDNAGGRSEPWSSRSPTTTDCCCSTPRICARWLQYVGDHASTFQTRYGNISAASIGAIQRGLQSIEDAGRRPAFFGEPMLNPRRPDAGPTGTVAAIVNILVADQLMNAPKLYATFLLWLMSELFEKLPEIGDPDKPKLVFFFDEAHLLFTDAPKPLLDKIEQVVRLIRSKGRRHLFRHAEPRPRRARHRARATRQPRAGTRCAAFTAARPEGRSRRRPRRCDRTRGSTSRSRDQPSSASAKRSCRSSTRRAGRCRHSGCRSCRRPARSGAISDAERQRADRRVDRGRCLRDDARSGVGLRDHQGPRRRAGRSGVRVRGTRGPRAPSGTADAAGADRRDARGRGRRAVGAASAACCSARPGRARRST